MTDQSKSAQQIVRDTAGSTDLVDLIDRQREAADLLLRVAQREEFDNPVTAVRAAASAARMYSDVCAGLVVEEKIAGLQAEVARIREENALRSRQGRHTIQNIEGGISVISGEPVKLPTWGRGPAQADGGSGHPDLHRP